jgi:hypothetical protein
MLEADRADGPAAIVTLSRVPGQIYRMLTSTNLNEAPWKRRRRTDSVRRVHSEADQ